MKNVIFLFVSLLVFTSCKKEIGKVDYIRTSFQVHRYADYSDDGDFWEEEVSDVWYVESVNGDVIGYNCPKDQLVGVRCKTPPQIYKYEKGYEFDGLRVRAKFNAIITTTLGVFETDDYQEYQKLYKAMLSYDDVVFTTISGQPKWADFSINADSLKKERAK